MKIPGGAILSVRYSAPPDTGEVHLIFIAPDSTYCYSGYRVMDRFPPLKNFDISAKWKKCEDSSGTVSNATGIQYRGEEKEVLYKDKSYPAEVGSVFAVINKGTKESNIRRIEDVTDLKNLPSATRRKLEAFLRDSLGWSDIQD